MSRSQNKSRINSPNGVSTEENIPAKSAKSRRSSGGKEKQSPVETTKGVENVDVNSSTDENTAETEATMEVDSSSVQTDQAFPALSEANQVREKSESSIGRISKRTSFLEKNTESPSVSEEDMNDFLRDFGALKEDQLSVFAPISNQEKSESESEPTKLAVPLAASTETKIGSEPNQLPTVKESKINREVREYVIKTLSDLSPTQEADCFVQLIECEKLRTKDGKPYFRATFRDRKRSVQTLLWNNSPLFSECEQKWRLGKFYKIRATLRDTDYGPKLEIRRIRETESSDRNDGFDPNKCRPSSDVPAEAVISEILELAGTYIEKGPLLNLIQRIFKDNRFALCEASASRSHHRVYVGGLLEHTLSVVKIAISLADHFLTVEPRLQARLSKPLIVAGSILHDIGKLLDTQNTLAGPKHTIAGNLVGHAILGLEIVQRYAREVNLDDNLRFQLEHAILSHSRFAEWGAPIPPSTLEAMIIHYADYADSSFISALNIIDADEGGGDFTHKKSPFGNPIFKSKFRGTETIQTQRR